MSATNPLVPTASDLAREACYVCRPDGYAAIWAESSEAVSKLVEHYGFARVVFLTVQCRYVCPVNGDDAEWFARLPHRPDGQRLVY